MSQPTSKFSSFIGGSPAAVAVKLLLISLLVGGVMSSFGWTPLDIVDKIFDLFRGIWNLGFGVVEKFGSYILLGATLVIPMWLFMRVMAMKK